MLSLPLVRLQNIKTADWSDEVAPFWGAVIKSAVSLEGIKGLFSAGWTTIKVSNLHQTHVACGMMSIAFHLLTLYDALHSSHPCPQLEASSMLDADI